MLEPEPDRELEAPGIRSIGRRAVRGRIQVTSIGSQLQRRGEWCGVRGCRNCVNGCVEAVEVRMIENVEPLREQFDPHPLREWNVARNAQIHLVARVS